VVAAEVARLLGAPLDAAVVRKLGVPTHPEFAMGAIARGVRVMDPTIVRDTGVSPEQFAFVEDMETVELDRRIGRFRADGSRIDIAGRVAIVVDDGVATGATATAACLALRARGPAAVVLAVPVAPATWRPEPGVVDRFIVGHAPRDFWAVGQFYRDFAQTTDEEVERLLTPDLPR
jgi:putative phosphoribosyl transferase